jgi:hypothetical protein
VVHAASVVEEDVLVSDHEVFMTKTDRYLLFNPAAVVSVQPTSDQPRRCWTLIKCPLKGQLETC